MLDAFRCFFDEILFADEKAPVPFLAEGDQPSGLLNVAHKIELSVNNDQSEEETFILYTLNGRKPVFRNGVKVRLSHFHFSFHTHFTIRLLLPFLPFMR